MLTPEQIELQSRIIARSRSQVGKIEWQHAQSTDHTRDCFTFLLGVATAEGISLPLAKGYSRFASLKGIQQYCEENLVTVNLGDLLQAGDIPVMQYSTSIHLGILDWDEVEKQWYLIHCSVRTGKVSRQCFDNSFKTRWGKTEYTTYRLPQLNG